MPAHNTAASYGSVAKTFHWLTAMLIFTVIPLGIIANGLPYETSEELAQKAWLFSMHKTVGITLFFVALARIAWAFPQPKPAALHPDAKAESFLAELVHWLLYGSLIIVPLSGWVHHAATTGFAPIWWPFGQDLFFVPKSDVVAGTSAGLHVVFERVLVISILLHVAGALKHLVIDRDGTLRRMLPFGGNVALPQTIASHSVTPAIFALAIWGVAIGIGGALGLYGAHGGPEIEAEALAEVASDWQVQDGSIEISVNQFGSDVVGSFAEWTSEIAFTPSDGAGDKGSVRTVISIPSLTLGSVTSQAMEPDFFDAATHQTAVFEGPISALETGAYVSEGTLTMKGMTQPVTLNFTLVVDGATAKMEGSTVLNRLDFGVGASMADESSLGFDVEVSLAVTATRSG